MLCRLFLFLVHNSNVKVTAYNICEVIEGVFCNMAHVMQEDMEKGNEDIDNISISKICQIAIDAAAVSQSLVHIGDMITSALVYFHKQESMEDNVATMITKSRREFDHVSTIAYECLYDVLRHKLRELMSCIVFIDWNAKKDTGTCFELILEITNYLQVTMQWLVNVPAPIRENAHFMCCNTINEGLVSFLTSGPLKTITVASLRDIDCSISHLELFSDRCSVRNLSLCFGEVKSLVSILLDKSTPHAIIDNLQAFCAKHKNVNMIKLAMAYEKLCGSPVETHIKTKAVLKLKQITDD